MSFCLHLRVLPRPTAGTVLGQHVAEGLLLMLHLLMPEPWKARLVAVEKSHQLLLWLDVQLDVSKQLHLPIPLHALQDFSLSAQLNTLALPPFPSHGKSGLKLCEMAKLILASTAVQPELPLGLHTTPSTHGIRGEDLANGSTEG